MRFAQTLLLSGLVALWWSSPTGAQTLTDAFYNSHHPRLLLNASELPALRARLLDGGLDDATYVHVRDVVQEIYPTMSYADIFSYWYGEHAIPCIGIVGHCEGAAGADALALGKALTLHITDTYEPDWNEANSGMRLRSLALGYDMFFANATVEERTRVRDELVAYIQKMVWTEAYQVFEQPPYLSNHSAMFGAALGLAAISLQDEAEAYLLEDAMTMADTITDHLLQQQFDPGGSYNEGAFYAAWTLQQLVFYFDARHRFDGRSYAGNPLFRAVEEWFAYELSPTGGGRSHNLNDSPLLKLAQHPAYFNWALGARNSGLAAWLWEHTAGGLGANFGGEFDWAGTILWHRSLPPTDPNTVLPRSRVWTQRGLYYYRSGWQTGTSSNDVVFNFYSGKFRGGHAQEDQNQFALTAYGTGFAIDHGAGSVAKESESHNMVFIDGKGQHNAGSSIGTDGEIVDYLLGGFADFVSGDATAAYGTYSPYNAPNVPIYGTNWSWGYVGANPVQHAVRNVLMVHGSAGLPYAVVMDDIDKDGAAHNYEWRLHTAGTNNVNITANPLTLSGAGGAMNLHLLDPDFAGVTVATAPYDAQNSDPAATLIKVSRNAVNPRFTFLMLPRATGTSAPPVARQSFTWGCGATISWGGGRVDVLVRNDSGAAVSYGGITTDARIAVVRKHGSTVESYMMAQARSLVVGSVLYASIDDAIVSCDWMGDTVRLNRYDADFRIRNTGITRVFYREQQLGFVVDDGYIVPGGVTGVETPGSNGGLSVSAHPNPFNPSTVISIEAAPSERASVVIYDVAGRRVRGLWSGAVAPARSLVWDGRDDGGEPVASGTYFVRVATPSETRTLKLTLVK